MNQIRILLITYNYPPGGGVGSIRASKFAKYLPDQWNIHVLTAADNIGPNTDISIDDGGNVTVHEVSEFLPNSPKEFNKIRWVPPLCWKIRQLHERYSFDAIWHTAGPFLPLLSTVVITSSVEVPYLVDFRDAWTLQPYRPKRTVFGQMHDVVSTSAEPRILRRATAVTTATSGITRAYQNRYPELSSKFKTVENGYDPDDFPDVDVEQPNRFTIVYVGKFGHYRDVAPFLRALADIKTETGVQFVHVGEPEQDVVSTVAEFGLADQFTCTGFVDRSAVARHIHRADLGLAVSGGSPQEMTTKIFDYIACETPILACGPSAGAMAEVVSQFDHGYVTENEFPAIEAALSDIVATDPRSLGEGPYAEYTREQAGEKLAEIVLEAV
ncbi:glycosyltransferase [Halosolutus gelatinilyticus]|uniref:glycosyltransferase n=1 Tax=Halosolutus gelatinilyticus TaxID=2931975 RepID=UPI001FF527B6|nr:glycosyltransferase [Halosolutus gelatinilyticus]